MSTVYCPALFLAAPASGQGKTTITAALARLLKRQGKEVRVFKTGPDYLDPQILQQASGNPVEQLDTWMAGANYCQQKLYEAAQQADLILIEGVMGMFDGTPSSADFASRFNLPVAIVMDVKGMAQTAGAIVLGMKQFQPNVSVIGLIANNCSTLRHRELIQESLSKEVPLLFTLPKHSSITLPERHLGLVQASEVSKELETKFETGADYLEQTGALDSLYNLPQVAFNPSVFDQTGNYLRTVTIGIAKDAAFSFIYQANINLLRSMGAKLSFFSPLEDTKLPNVDALWFPGGYPELHAKQLSKNSLLLSAISDFYKTGNVILAECGGMLYCLNTLTDLHNQTFNMAGLLDGHGAMRGKRGCQGMQTAPLPEGDVRGHSHHRSRTEILPEPITYGKRQKHPAPGEPIYRQGSLTASYLHLFFPSNPNAVARLFNPGGVEHE